MNILMISTQDAVNVIQSFWANIDWLIPTVVMSVIVGIRNIYKRIKVDMTLTLKLSTKEHSE